MLDICIRNATIVDGSGAAPYQGDVGICGDTIAVLGNVREQAACSIDARGLHLTPGFIDMHCHSDAIVFAPEKNARRLLAGVTTEIVGNCGISPAPVKSEHLALLQTYCAATYSGQKMPWDWKQFGEYLCAVEQQRPLLNFGALVGHGSIRIAVMGFENRPPEENEMERMKGLLRESLRQGAVGLSLGLIYPPGVFAGTEELEELARVVREEDKVLTVHMRNESNLVVEALQEMLGIMERTGVRMHISHHKIGSLREKGKSHVTVDMIERAAAQKYDIAMDVYPYTAGCTQLSSILPPWVHEGGIRNLLERLRDQKLCARIAEEIASENGDFDSLTRNTTWDKIMVSHTGSGKHLGLSIAQIAQKRGLTELDCALSLIREEQNDIMMILYTMSDEDVEHILCSPLAAIASDGVPAPNESTHPRYLGSFTRVLAHYQKEKNLFSLAEAIRKMTSLPASRCGLHDRGWIQAGKKADLVLMDMTQMEDVTTYGAPNKTCPGMQAVFVNGVQVVKAHHNVGKPAGVVLKN